MRKIEFYFEFFFTMMKFWIYSFIVDSKRAQITSRHSINERQTWTMESLLWTINYWVGFVFWSDKFYSLWPYTLVSFELKFLREFDPTWLILDLESQIDGMEKQLRLPAWTGDWSGKATFGESNIRTAADEKRRQM